MSLNNRYHWMYIVFFLILIVEALVLNLLGLLPLVNGAYFALVFVLPFASLPVTWWLTGKNSK